MDWNVNGSEEANDDEGLQITFARLDSKLESVIKASFVVH